MAENKKKLDHDFEGGANILNFSGVIEKETIDAMSSIHTLSRSLTLLLYCSITILLSCSLTVTLS